MDVLSDCACAPRAGAPRWCARLRLRGVQRATAEKNTMLRPHLVWSLPESTRIFWMNGLTDRIFLQYFFSPAGKCGRSAGKVWFTLWPWPARVFVTWWRGKMRFFHHGYTRDIHSSAVYTSHHVASHVRFGKVSCFQHDSCDLNLTREGEIYRLLSD